MDIKKNLLFVDDDPGILKSLSRTFNGNSYNIFLAGNASEGLKIIKKENIDLVLSDLLMPEINGHEFLKQVRKYKPETIRLILSGYAEKETILKGILSGTVHTYITKPWNINELRNEIARMIRLKSSLNRKESKIILLDKLNSVPSFSPRFSEFFSSREELPSLEDLINFTSEDMVKTAQLLRIANSSFFGGKFTSIRDAIVFLGSRSVFNILTSIEIYEQLSVNAKHKEELRKIWENSLLSNRILNALHKFLFNENVPDEYRTASLLHHSGIMFFASFMPDSYDHLIENIRLHPEISLETLEKKEMGITHTEFGAHLLQWWHLPEILIRASLFHHGPFSKKDKISALCYVADRFIDTYINNTGDLDIKPEALDALEIKKSDILDFSEYYKEFPNES